MLYLVFTTENILLVRLIATYQPYIWWNRWKNFLDRFEEFFSSWTDKAAIYKIEHLNTIQLKRETENQRHD